MSVEAPLGRAGDRGLRNFATSSRPEAPPPVQPVRTRRRHETAAVVAVPLLGLLLCIAATRTNTLVPESVRPMPGWMAGPFNFIGIYLGRAVLVFLVGLMVLSYVFAVRFAERVSTRTVIVSVIALNLVALLAPPMFSTDVFSYQAYARMFAIYHINPYLHGPYAISSDPIYRFIGADWIYTPSVYGPLFTLISAPLAWTSVVFSEVTFRVIAAVCSAGTLLLIWKSSRLRDVNPIRGIALFGLSPLVTMYGVGGGHNDMLMVTLMTAGVYATLQNRGRSAGALMMTGTAIKLTGGILLPFALLADRGVGPDGRERGGLPRQFLIGAIPVAVVVGVASSVFFGNGVVHMLNTLQSVQDRGGWQSIPGFVLSVIGIGVSGWMRTLMSVVLAAIIVRLLQLVWRRKLDWLDGAAWATLAVLATAWAMLPWYVVWLMPLVALSKDRRLWRAAIAISLIAGAMMVADVTPQGIPGITL